jgi:hypothetical protein
LARKLLPLTSIHNNYFIKKMKSIIKYFIMIVVLGSLSTATLTKTASAQGGEVSFQIFYDQLAPYGHWVDFPDEGYVWVPNVSSGFTPYQTSGYWVYTDYGWTWVSDYPWGWATFHYGRWDFDDDYGWYWVPEYEWAPAWVAWASYPGYYGWAPLRPGIEVDAAITTGYYVPYEHWCFVHEEYLGSRDMYRHYAPRSENMEHVRNSTMINRTNIDSRRTTYMGGPPREQVEKSTGKPLQQLTIVPRSTPGLSVAANKVSIYKPAVTPPTRSNTKPAPRAVASIADLKPLPGRTPNPERLNAASPSRAATQEIQQKGNPVATPPPAIRQQSQQNNSQAPPQQNTRQVTPEPRQQPPAQQNAPREVQQQQTPPREVQQQQTPPRAVQQQQQQSIPLRQQRTMRYVPPAYQSPKPYNPPQQQHNAPPQQSAPQPHAAPPPQQRAEPPHAAPPQQQQPHGPPQQDGRPHQ